MLVLLNQLLIPMSYGFVACLCFVQSNLCKKTTFKKKKKNGFQDQLSRNAGQKYCSMLQVGLTFVIKIFVLSVFSGCFTQSLTVMSKKLK